MRIGVFICHCGTNIAGTVNIAEVVEAAKRMPMVAYVDDNKYTCSDPGQASIREAISQHRLNRVVVASCSPRMHETTFRRTVLAAGLNPYLLEMANLREQCSWVHSDEKEAATEKAIELVRKAVAKVRRYEALSPKQIGITKRALVIGGGIAGMQAALDIGNAGYEVVLVEREPTIGGRMAQLDKTFPTLDCSSCILTPKMVDVGRHPNITLLTHSEVEGIEGFVGNFKAKITKKTRYVDESKCTSCGECARGCPVTMSNEFELGMGERKAAYVPFPQAVPNVYIIDKREERPCKAACKDACPIHMNVPGYIALIAEGKSKEAYELMRRTNPLPAICGRVCYAPCEDACNRGQLDEPIASRALKRFVAEQVDMEGLEVPQITRNGNKVAIIGSGPAGLAAAHDLALEGYEVTIFEALPEPGGMLRVGIPDYRLPKDILNKEIGFIERLGVEIKTNTRIGEEVKLEDLKKSYQAIFISTGAHESLRLEIPGEDAAGVIHGVDFLRDVNMGKKVALGKRVAVIGGGNAAIDASRVAKRAGAEVEIIYRRSRAEMPATPSEVEAAEAEGVKITFLATPTRIIAKDGKASKMECIRMELGEPDDSGRRRPIPIEGSEFVIGVDTVIPALGQASNVEFAKGSGLEVSGRGTIAIDESTLATNVEGIFAGGDVVTGPAMVIDAIAAGKKAARSIDEYLKGEALTSKEDKRTPEKLSEEEIADIKIRFPSQDRVRAKELEPKERIGGFEEVEQGYTPPEAQEEARRCLASQIEGCIGCDECQERCEAEAIIHEMQDEHIELDVGAIVTATGYYVPDASNYEVYGGGKYPDVITSLQLERLMSSFGPTGGEIVRPSDGAHPKKVVFISCVGSRDEKTGKGYCSRVCCMHMAKHAIMLKEHDPEVQSYIFYTDVRGPGGKIFEDFLQRVQEEAGAIYLRGEVTDVYQQDGKVVVCGKDLEKDKAVKLDADLVVLASVMIPSAGATQLARTLNISYDERGFILEAHPKLRPVETHTDGIFLAGVCTAPLDIPESVAQGGAAAAQVVTLFGHDTLSTDPMIATVDSMVCAGCLLCADVCPFKAISPEVLKDGRTVAAVNESICKGCGLCVAVCRSGAASLQGFAPKQLFAEVTALWR